MNEQRFLEEISRATLRGDLKWNKEFENGVFQYRAWVGAYRLTAAEDTLLVTKFISGGSVTYTYETVALTNKIELRMKAAQQQQQRDDERELVELMKKGYLD